MVEFCIMLNSLLFVGRCKSIAFGAVAILINNFSLAVVCCAISFGCVVNIFDVNMDVDLTLLNYKKVRLIIWVVWMINLSKNVIDF